MPLAIRVIPCLDVHDGRVVKGVNFLNLRDAGDPGSWRRLTVMREPTSWSPRYLGVIAGRATTYDMVRRTAETVFIPLTVGGGVRGVDDVDTLLRTGADKVGINTGAISRPEAITEITQRFGNQVLVLSLDARRSPISPPDSASRPTAGGVRLAWTPSPGCERPSTEEPARSC